MENMIDMSVDKHYAEGKDLRRAERKIEVGPWSRGKQSEQEKV